VGLQAPRTRVAHTRTVGASAARTLRGIHRAPPGAWAAPLHGANPNTTWRLGLGKGHD